MPISEKLIPVLVYRDLASARDFLVAAFGFEPGEVNRGADGTATHAEVSFGAAPIWLHRETAEHQLVSPERSNTASGGLVLYVPDVDAHCARARAAGARIQHEPMDQPYGQREYEARDPEGHRWWFATPLAAPTLAAEGA